MKVLYNAKYGGFSFSDAFVDEFKKRHPEKKCKNGRTDPDVIALFEEMGSERSSGRCANLQIEEIPDDVEFEIDEYDGMETVSWDVPKELIIRDLLDLYRLKKTPNQCNTFTQMLLKEDCSIYRLRSLVLTASIEKESGKTSTET